MRFAIKSIITAAVLGASAFGVASANAASLEILGTGHSMDLNTVHYNPAPSSAVGNFLSQNSSNPAFNKQIVYFDEENKITNGLINGLALLGGPAIVRFTYLGTEAGNDNYFDLSDSLVLDSNNEDPNAIFHNHSTAPGDFVELTFGPGGIELGDRSLLPFGFITDGRYTRNAGAIADNAGITTEDSDPQADPPDQMKLGFSTQSFKNSEGGDIFLVFLGDGLGDSDFDDMIIGVGVFAVPVPPAAILLLSGLFGLGALKRLRRPGMTA